jgi:hypothetical protein
VLELCPDPEVWKAWWNQYGKGVNTQLRYRFGRPWTPEDDWVELEDPVSVNEDRLLCALELAAYGGATLTLDLDHFVSRQLRQIAALRAQRLTVQPGGWPP